MEGRYTRRATGPVQLNSKAASSSPRRIRPVAPTGRGTSNVAAAAENIRVN